MVGRLLLVLGTLLIASCGGGGGGNPPPSPAPPPPPPPPAPTITSLTPNTAMASGSNFVLTVTGTGFVASSVIRWNGTDKVTTFVNETNLQTPIAASDIATAGTPTITIVNPPASGGNSSAATFTINNPAPTVSALSPAFVAPGGPQFTLIVDGTGFVAASLVRWNGADRATTFVSATQLSATITAADIATQSQAQVAVFNAAPGGGTSGSFALAVGNPVPHITQFIPSVVRPGGPDLNLTVSGSAFVSGASVTWNGAVLPTTFVSDTQLQVAVPASNIAVEGVARIVASNPVPGGGASSAAVLSVAPFGVIGRVSVASDGSEANGHSDTPSISATGRYVAFTSVATNLVPNDSNGVQDIFVRDTCTGATGCTPSTERISVATDGSAGNDASDSPSISADGRYVAFSSLASNLVAADTNAAADIFVRDTCVSAGAGCTPSTTRVSLASDGSQGSLGSRYPSISADGRFVGFISDGILVLGDINNQSDAFVRDTCFGAAGCTPSTARVSTGFDTATFLGSRLFAGSLAISVGANGRYVAFTIYSGCTGCNLKSGWVIVLDSCVNAPAGCTPATFVTATGGGDFYSPAISDRALSIDGRFVTNVMGDDRRNAYLAASCISAPAGCSISNLRLTNTTDSAAPNPLPTLSPSGRFLVYNSTGPTSFLVSQAYAYDTCLGAPAGCLPAEVRLSENAAGAAGNRQSFSTSISSDGDLVAFVSEAATLVPNDTNAKQDIFLARTGLTFK